MLGTAAARALATAQEEGISKLQRAGASLYLAKRLCGHIERMEGEPADLVSKDHLTT